VHSDHYAQRQVKEYQQIFITRVETLVCYPLWVKQRVKHDLSFIFRGMSLLTFITLHLNNATEFQREFCNATVEFSFSRFMRIHFSNEW